MAARENRQNMEIEQARPHHQQKNSIMTAMLASNKWQSYSIVGIRLNQISMR